MRVDLLRQVKRSDDFPLLRNPTIKMSLTSPSRPRRRLAYSSRKSLGQSHIGLSDAFLAIRRTTPH
ncbi:MAG: hypothetical protein QXH56_07830 [Thermoprotei archaeon]